MKVFQSTVSFFVFLPALACLCFISSSRGADLEFEDLPAESAAGEPVLKALSAVEVLDNMLARLPKDRLSIGGELLVRKRQGIVVRELLCEMILDWGSNPSTAEYTISDAAGAVLETLTVERRPDFDPVYRHICGNAGAMTGLFDPYAAVQGSDVSWADLTLSFLWWRNKAALVGTEHIKGRSCYKVEVRPPEGVASAAGTRPYDRVILWVDEKLYMLLQAEGYDASGAAVRRLWVRSFRKTNDRWMIKDMEIQGGRSQTRTKLRVNDIRESGMTAQP